MVLGISKIDVSAKEASFEFKANTPIDGLAIIKLIQSGDGYRMTGSTSLKYSFKHDKDVAGRTNAVFELLHYFGKNLVNE